MPGSLRPMHVLVIGGTGPTGIPLVQGLVDRGHHVTILHRGTHERPETPAAVEHLHTDPFDEDALRAALDGRTFDVAYAMYGRLRMIAEVLRGRTGRFVSVGGVPAYRGWMNAWLYDPPGLPVPVGEDAPTVDDAEDDEKGYRIVRTEEAVFAAHPDATHFRYPYVYGPYQLDAARVDRRAPHPRRPRAHRRRRRRPHAAPPRLHREHRPRAAARARAARRRRREDLQHRRRGGAVGPPGRRARRRGARPPARDRVDALRPRGARPGRCSPSRCRPTGCSTSRGSRTDLGYHDVVPARRPSARTARWLAEHPLRAAAPEEHVLTDPFDYAAEDRLIDAWHGGTRHRARVRRTTPEPRYGLAYSGPGGRPRSRPEFEA